MKDFKRVQSAVKDITTLSNNVYEWTRQFLNIEKRLETLEETSPAECCSTLYFVDADSPLTIEELYEVNLDTLEINTLNGDY